ncbi:hypothetical protein B5X24_HaOG206152 [Helicoverpa armigera]|nr:hypothetical protein B5X24_HaOG206152 [Helicoverpa armigera]
MLLLGRCLEFCGQRGGSGGGAGAAGSYAYNQMDRHSNTAARERATSDSNTTEPIWKILSVLESYTLPQ